MEIPAIKPSKAIVQKIFLPTPERFLLSPVAAATLGSFGFLSLRCHFPFFFPLVVSSTGTPCSIKAPAGWGPPVFSAMGSFLADGVGSAGEDGNERSWGTSLSFGVAHSDLEAASVDLVIAKLLSSKEDDFPGPEGGLPGVSRNSDSFSNDAAVSNALAFAAGAGANADENALLAVESPGGVSNSGLVAGADVS